MQRSDKILCLFTAEFPYGNKSETFLETEILFLSKGFREVHVFPSVKSKFVRVLPANVKVIDDFSNLNFSKKKKLAGMFGSPFLLLRILSYEMRDKGFLRVLRNRNVLFEYLSTQLIIGKKLLNYLLRKMGFRRLATSTKLLSLRRVSKSRTGSIRSLVVERKGLCLWARSTMVSFFLKT